VQYTSVGNNPFAVLTAIVAPAILTNASSILALGTSNRVARVVDRTRIVAAELAKRETGSSEYEAWSAQLLRLDVRAQLLVKALRLFYAALGLFAAASLVSVGGSMAAYYGDKLLFQLAAALAIATGASAVIGLAAGCTIMIRETHLAIQNLSAEAGLRTNDRPPDRPWHS
jgi:Protein of unknown function (DUF2721)